MSEARGLLAVEYEEGLTRLRELTERFGFQDYLAAMSQVARRSVVCSSGPPIVDRDLGASYLGGVPELPQAMQLPQTDGKHWLFLGQVRLEEIAALQKYLPRRGLLCFFVEDLVYANNCRVIFLPGTARLVRRPEAAANWYDEDQIDPLPEASLSFRADVSLPVLYNDDERLVEESRRLLEIVDGRYTDPKQEKIAERYDEMRDETKRAADNGDTHIINGFVFTQHESPEEHAAAAMGGESGDWTVLMQFSSDARPGFCFCDAGTLSFAIRKDDLAEADFSRVFASIESS